MNLPATQTGDPMEEFRQRVLEKLRADIGAMLPDEALTGLVQQAVKEQFFAERKLTDSYGRVTDSKPSWFVEEVAKLGEPIIREHIRHWMADNHALIDEAIKKFLADQNLMLLMVGAMQSATTSQIFEAANAFFERTKRGY